MDIAEATSLRIQQICKEKRMTQYALIYQAGMPPSTVKSIISGKSKNPGIVSIQKIADGLGVSLREFYNGELFENLDSEIEETEDQES
ncbi:MAG: helix-turn-helix domain-containing protein [Lachnospiraceae bacterium]